MKRIFLGFLAAAILLMAGVVQAKEQTITIEVSGLWCASCPFIAAKAIKSVASVEIVDGFYDPDLLIAQFIIEYDDEMTNLDTIVAALSEYGYPGKLIEQIAY